MTAHSSETPSSSTLVVHKFNKVLVNAGSDLEDYTDACPFQQHEFENLQQYLWNALKWNDSLADYQLYMPSWIMQVVLQEKLL